MIYHEPQLRVLEYRCASLECYVEYASARLGPWVLSSTLGYPRQLPLPACIIQFRVQLSLAAWHVVRTSLDCAGAHVALLQCVR